MKLVTVEIDRRPQAGILDGDNIALLGSSLKEVLASGADLRKLSAKQRIPAKSAKLLAPIPDPGIVLSVGMNYHEHLREMKTPVPEKPAAFTKSVASIIASGEPIRLPKSNPGMVDWEGEFSVVIGRPCHAVAAAEALDYVAGYTLVNDVSARDWVAPLFKAQGLMGPIHAWEHNLLGKMFPTFCPMGPCMVTKDEVSDPANVQIQTRLNGKVMQDANTDDLVFSVPRLIEYYSRFYLLRPGDVITTGSPSGVGFGRNPKVFMKPGDIIEVEVKQIGILRNPIEA
jgi:2-keto-4-pentenoate hydratase/2-oxohepta-3-ene-1,7-dioic acid hydratase in catechol pathway